MVGGDEAIRQGTLEDLLSGGPADFDAGVQQKLRGPEGADLRCAYLTEQFARRIHDGDLQEALQTMEKSFPSLGGLSPRQAAVTDGGMLAVRELIARMEWHARHRGVGAFLQACGDSSMREFTLLLDFLPIVWALEDEEFEELLIVPRRWLSEWRQHDLELEGPSRERLLRLRRFHDALRLVVQPREHASVWRTVWKAEGPIGQRSLWQAFQEDGDAVLDRMENYFWAVSELTAKAGSASGAADAVSHAGH